MVGAGPNKNLHMRPTLVCANCKWRIFKNTLSFLVYFKTSLSCPNCGAAYRVKRAPNFHLYSGMTGAILPIAAYLCLLVESFLPVIMGLMLIVAVEILLFWNRQVVPNCDNQSFAEEGSNRFRR
jgi:predicted RNA-binding Zn-ribbon protein involved in translation (DUF1610 family)